jgi:twitching motility protein PilT
MATEENVILTLLKLMMEKDGSDLHLTADSPSFLRANGHLKPDQIVSSDDFWRFLKVNHIDTIRLKKEKSIDFAFSFEKRRFRGNAYLAEGRPAAAIRMLPEKIPTLEDIDAPAGFMKLAEAQHGIIMVCGRTGEGKSTSLAALLRTITEQRAVHVITLEDPIEFRYSSTKSLIHQRELGRDFNSLSDALKASLRENPDIILVGELRDQDCIRTALAAAESGMLVLTTLHAHTAAEAPGRLADFFPANEQHAVRASLAASFTGIVAQRLVSAPYGRHAVIEVMLRTPAISRMIRDGDDSQIPSAMLAGARQGMTMFQQEGTRLFGSGKISEEGYQELVLR